MTMVRTPNPARLNSINSAAVRQSGERFAVLGGSQHRSFHGETTVKVEATTKSTWQEARLPHFGRVTRPRKFDVVVIGGGISGRTPPDWRGWVERRR
jgi:hypothetical protein